MPEARVDQRVQVDISGLQTPGVSIGGGVQASGVIKDIDPVRRLITVQLEVSFGGQNLVQVPPERVTAVEP
jgi:hypothetical protein